MVMRVDEVQVVREELVAAAGRMSSMLLASSVGGQSLAGAPHAAAMFVNGLVLT